MTSTTTRTHCPERIYIAADDEAQADYAACLQAQAMKRAAHRSAYQSYVLNAFESDSLRSWSADLSTADVALRANDYADDEWTAFLPAGTVGRTVNILDDHEMFQVPCNCGTGCGSLRWVSDSNLRHEDRHNETEAR